MDLGSWHKPEKAKFPQPWTFKVFSSVPSKIGCLSKCPAVGRKTPAYVDRLLQRHLEVRIFSLIR